MDKTACDLCGSTDVTTGWARLRKPPVAHVAPHGYERHLTVSVDVCPGCQSRPITDLISALTMAELLARQRSDERDIEWAARHARRSTAD
jgi:hypothetical protein